MKTFHRVKHPVVLTAILLMGVLAAALAVYSTRWGLWAGSDSAVYLTVARNILAGEGMRVIQPSGKAATLMPPLYPLSISALGWLPMPLPEAARWLNIILFAGAAILTGLIFYRFSRSPWSALSASLAAAVFPWMLDQFTGMMTEPLFLTLFLGSLFLLLAYLETGGRSCLAGAAFLAGLGVVTRFIGVVFLPAGVFTVLLFSRSSWKRRLSDSLVFSGISLLPLLLWAVWFYFNPDSSAPLDPPRWSDPIAYLEPVRNGVLRVFWRWLPFSDLLPSVPKVFRLSVVAGTLVLWTVGGAWAGLRLYGKRLQVWIAGRDVRMAGAAMLFVLSFLLGFTFIFLFRNPPQDVNERTLLPLFPLLMMFLFGNLSLFMRAAGLQKRRWINLLHPAILLVILAAYLPASLKLAQEYHAAGEGYSSPIWRDSETLRALSQVPEEMTIISNETGAVLYFTGRTALDISERYRTAPLETFTRFGDDLTDDAQVLFRQGKAVLVIFRQQLYWQLHPTYLEQTQARIDSMLQGLTPLAECADGAIYLYAAQD